MKLGRLLVVALLAALSSSPAAAQDQPAEDSYDPYFLGYETEPDMDAGGRVVASLHAGLSRLFGSIAPERTALAPAWEFPLGAVLLLVQHEVAGHGGRGRELGLGPSYGFGYDLSAYTDISRDPESNEQIAALAAGGVEADAVLARRVLLDLHRPEGADGAKVPMALMTKLDLSLYVFGTTEPGGSAGDREDFVEQLDEGNDMAIWLVARQAQRRGADPADVWNRRYEVDFEDPLLQDNWDDLRATAIWNLLDPSLWSALFGYFRDHAIGGEVRVRPPALRLGRGLGLTAGTRAALGPQAVSRFLDVHLLSERGVTTVYVRDLDSSTDRTWGLGAGLHGLPLGRARVGVVADVWEEPEAEEALAEGTGWHAVAEAELPLKGRWGLALKLGAKSDGWFPGTPMGSGVYGGVGVTAGW